VNCDCQRDDEQLCGCCTGTTQETPELIVNRPALSSIAYRVGRYSTFDASMLAALSDPDFPPLGLLRTRATDDFTIALLDSWAVVLDILTFYQERFANEAYLRTAVDQRSVFELAALVGYQPSPGVAASAILAFTLSSAAGSPNNVLIPAGSRVQSVPGPGQTAQVFETSADLNATIGWNALPAQTTSPWLLSSADTTTWITGIANNINVGDALLFIAVQDGQPVATGPSAVAYVTAVNTDAVSKNTQVSWELSAGSLPVGTGGTATADEVSLFTFRKKAALYGVQAPNPQTLAGSNIVHVPGWPNDPFANRWDYQLTGDDDQINLDASYPGISPPASSADGPPQWCILTGTEFGYTSVFQVQSVLETNPGYYTLTTKTTQLTLENAQILVGDTALGLEGVIYEFTIETPDITAYVQSVQLTPAPLPLTSWSLDGSYDKQQGMLAPVNGSSITVVGGQQVAAGQALGVSGKRLRLQIPAGAGASFVPTGSSGGTAAADGQIFLTNSFPPASDSSGDSIWSVTTLSGVSGSLTVPSGVATLFLPADKNDAVVGEAAPVQSAAPAGDLTTLTLNAALSGIYDASTFTVNANAVAATNGETVQEILGSGDATNPALTFTLKQAPVTYVSAPTTSGSRSTLQVWVNNLQWHETANLLTAGPADRVLVTSVSSAGNRVVQFGDGIDGARTPTGMSNIRAVYRKGIGTAGMVSAGQLTQPLDRPQGLSSVTNPSAATGAQDPATADQARASAPLPTLTIGRVVSLEDYQNFALGFAGIAKALATWTWFGDIRGVFLTVAGADGTTLTTDDPVVTSLIEAIAHNGDPHVPLMVASYVPVLFTFAADVAIDVADYAPDQVLAQVWQAVSAAFAFDNRQLGQPVAASQIIEIIQDVPGVIAVRVRGLGRSGGQVVAPLPAKDIFVEHTKFISKAAFAEFAGTQLLCAAGPMPPTGAQLLVLDPATQGQIGQWS
jgi:hypothetical protein